MIGFIGDVVAGSIDNDAHLWLWLLALLYPLYKAER
jgi:hypothetical protein